LTNGIKLFADEPRINGGNVASGSVGLMVPEFVGGLAVGEGPVPEGGVFAGAVALGVSEVVVGLAVGEDPVPDGGGVPAAAVGLGVSEVVGGLAEGTVATGERVADVATGEPDEATWHP
jgi:hypothetical protein